MEGRSGGPRDAPRLTGPKTESASQRALDCDDTGRGDQLDRGTCRGERFVLDEDVPGRFGELVGEIAQIEAATRAARDAHYRERYERAKQRLGRQRGAKVAGGLTDERAETGIPGQLLGTGMAVDITDRGRRLRTCP